MQIAVASFVVKPRHRLRPRAPGQIVGDTQLDAAGRTHSHAARRKTAAAPGQLGAVTHDDLAGRTFSGERTMVKKPDGDTDAAAAELQKLGLEALRAHGGSEVPAAPKFAAMLRNRPDLLLAMFRDRDDLLVPPVREYLRGVAAQARGPTVKPIKVREHRRQRQRTPEEKAAILRVTVSLFDRREINGRPVGDMRWGEVQHEVRDNAVNAASYLRLGTQATANALLLKKILDHAVVQDHSTKIRDVISPELFARLDEEATKEAPLFIEKGMRRYATSLETSKEIGP
jgi:hypothetical protein